MLGVLLIVAHGIPLLLFHLQFSSVAALENEIDNIKINNKKIGKITKSLALSFYKSIIY